MLVSLCLFQPPLLLSSSMDNSCGDRSLPFSPPALTLNLINFVAQRATVRVKVHSFSIHSHCSAIFI